MQWPNNGGNLVKARGLDTSSLFRYEKQPFLFDEVEGTVDSNGWIVWNGFVIKLTEAEKGLKEVATEAFEYLMRS